MWNKISVKQYQDIYKVVNEEDDGTEGLTKDMKILSIIHDISLNDLDSFSISDINEMRKGLKFLEEQPEPKKVKMIKANGNYYRFQPNIKHLPFARYIETKAFSEGIIENMHKIAATMMMPQKRAWFGLLVDDKYNAAKHEQYANDLSKANYAEVFFCFVYFYQVYRNWIEVSKDYMVRKMVNLGATKEEALMVVTNLCDILDGNIQPNLLQTMKIAELQKFMKKAQ